VTLGEIAGSSFVSVYDITHVLRFNHVYEPPFGRAKEIGSNWHPLGEWFSRRIAGQWSQRSV
jgi:hypothetical protein